MESYILNRLRIDAARVLALARNEALIQHYGLRGRLRELLIDDYLLPWLPPYISCGTGTIIDAEGKYRPSTQDDIILYDKSLSPPILTSSQAPEGVFLYNSVIARIEVKSTLDRDDIRKFVSSSKDIANLKFTVQEGFNGSLQGALNMLFAYESDLHSQQDPDREIRRMLDVMQEEGVDVNSGIVSVMCLPGRGLWKIGLDDNSNRCWQKLKFQDNNAHLAWFLGCISNSCYQEHAKRQGRDPSRGLEGGIGTYIPGGSDIWHFL
jgi:hypothetical protein